MVSTFFPHFCFLLGTGKPVSASNASTVSSNPPCTGHGVPSKLIQVKKEGPNKVPAVFSFIQLFYIIFEELPCSAFILFKLYHLTKHFCNRSDRNISPNVSTVPWIETINKTECLKQVLYGRQLYALGIHYSTRLCNS